MPGPSGPNSQYMPDGMERQRHNVIEHTNNVHRYDETTHRALVAYRSSACNSSFGLCRELVPAQSGKRTYTRSEFSALRLRHSPDTRMVFGAFDLVGTQTPRPLDQQFGLGSLADTRRFLQRSGVSRCISCG